MGSPVISLSLSEAARVSPLFLSRATRKQPRTVRQEGVMRNTPPPPPLSLSLSSHIDLGGPKRHTKSCYASRLRLHKDASHAAQRRMARLTGRSKAQTARRPVPARAGPP